MNPLSAITLGTILAASGQNPQVSMRAYTGDLQNQQFIMLEGTLQQTSKSTASASWRSTLQTSDGRSVKITFDANSSRSNGREKWSYSVRNNEKNLTVCQIDFPIVKDVKIGDSYDGDKVIWPGLYRGALIDDIRTKEAFEQQARQACKNVPYLYGLYQGDLCLPYFVHQGKEGSFGMMVRDPTHEIVKLAGVWAESGITYSVSAYPKLTTGKSWKFGDIEIFADKGKDWHAAADRYREWLISQRFGPDAPRHREPATLQYGRWDDLQPDTIIKWAKAFGINDVLLWVVLYGRGDQYYPCYFPNLNTTGYDGMKKDLDQLNAEGLNPYFYTNGYLLSPLQTRADVEKWNKEHPDIYPDEVARNDFGYADTVAEFRLEGHDFAGDWLQTPGGIDPLRVRRVDFQWGEFPLYAWHGRPFWAACVSSPAWRKMFRDTARMHAELGAKGIYIDQPGAIQPEFCSATGHGHDNDSFGLWNRAYLELMREVKETGDKIAPGFFIEIEGSADLYGKYCDRSLGNFNLREVPGSFSKMLRYTAPWLMTDYGIPSLTDAPAMKEFIEDSFLLGGTFRVMIPNEIDNSLLETEAAGMMKSAIAIRRKLSPYIDYGRFLDNLGVTADGCDTARFDSDAGQLVVIRVKQPVDRVTLSQSADSKIKPLLIKDAVVTNWQTQESKSISITRLGSKIVIKDQKPGFYLITIPRASTAGSR